MAVNTVELGYRVTLHFALKLTNNQIIDSTFEKKPVNLIVGDGDLPANFEQFILGMHVGERKQFLVPAKDAFGLQSPMNIQNISRDKFNDEQDLSIGMVISFSDMQNKQLPGVIKTIADRYVEVDFNHPLAGKELQFEVEILQIGD